MQVHVYQTNREKANGFRLRFGTLSQHRERLARQFNPFSTLSQHYRGMSRNVSVHGMWR